MKKFYFLVVTCVFLLNIGNLNAQTIWTGPDFTYTKTAGADWTQEANQDRITDNVWITRQNKKPIYNYKWWQDTFSEDASSGDIYFEIFNEANSGPPQHNFTATGGTKGVKWTLIDDTGATSDWTGFNKYGELGNSSNFYSFHNVMTMVYILENVLGDYSTISSTDDFTVNVDGNGYDLTSIGDDIVGKKFGIWLVEDDIYLTITFTFWGEGDTNTEGAFTYIRSSDQSLSVKAFESKNNLNIFPNPSAEFIQISGLSENEHYSIYNILGHHINSGTLVNNAKVDISDFATGLYFLKLGNGNTAKFLKE